MIQETIYLGLTPAVEISQAFCSSIESLLKKDPAVVYLDADLMASMKTHELWKKYPKQVFNCGIQESNMVGVAAGMSLAGCKPYIHSFAPFITRRVFDQVFLSIGYAQKSVRLIGSDAGITASYNGGTHMCFEDVGLMRTIPKSCVVDVSDSTMFVSLLTAAKDRPGVTYFRTARRGVPDIYPPNTEFAIGRAKQLTKGNDVTIIASGIMVGTALDAASLLQKQGINARVIDIVTIKPLDTELVKCCAKETGAIVTVENHNIIGGLGSAVAEFLSECFPVPVLRVGIADSYGQVGDEAFLRTIYGLTAQNIMEKVGKVMKLKNKDKGNW